MKSLVLKTLILTILVTPFFFSFNYMEIIIFNPFTQSRLILTILHDKIIELKKEGEIENFEQFYYLKEEEIKRLTENYLREKGVDSFRLVDLEFIPIAQLWAGEYIRNGLNKPVYFEVRWRNGLQIHANDPLISNK